MKHINSATFVAINVAVICGAGLIALRPDAREFGALASWAASTFVGAWFAFQFCSWRSERAGKDSDLRAGNMALVVLIEFLDRDLQYQRRYVEPVRNNSNFWWIMRPGQDLDSVALEIDHAGLSFLLQTNADVWRAIVLEERRHKLVAKTIAERTKLMLEIVFPKFESAGLQNGQAVSGEDVERILGPTITANLKEDTKAVVEMIDDNIQSLENCIAVVRAALSSLHPGSELVVRPDSLEAAHVSSQ